MMFSQPDGANNERPFQTINRLRKSGALEDAWNFGVEEVQKNPQDSYVKGAFFWVCYDYLKSIQKPIVERGKASKNFLPQQHEFSRITQYLDWVMWLELPTTGFEYPRLLFLFRQNAEYFPQLIQLVLKHRLNVFDEQAREPFALEKGEVPSLLLTYARKLGKHWLSSDDRSSADLEAVLAFMNEARFACKDTQHKIWLDYDQARCLVDAKRYEEARELVIPILKKKQRESWAWGALASTYKESDVGAAICLYSQGVDCSHDERFSLPLLRALTLLFKSQGRVNEASMCLKKAVACYEKNGWKVKPGLQRLQAEPWYDANVNVELLSDEIKQCADGASSFLHGKTVNKVGLVVAIHQSKKGCNVYLGPKSIISVPMFAIKGNKPKVGDYLQVELSEESSKPDVISAKICTGATLDGVQAVEKPSNLWFDWIFR